MGAEHGERALLYEKNIIIRESSEITKFPISQEALRSAVSSVASNDEKQVFHFYHEIRKTFRGKIIHDSLKKTLPK